MRLPFFHSPKTLKLKSPKPETGRHDATVHLPRAGVGDTKGHWPEGKVVPLETRVDGS